MSLIIQRRGLIGAALCVFLAGAATAQEADAATQLHLEARADGKCQNLSEGGKLVVLRSASSRPIHYRLVRYFANVPQSPTVGRLSPEEPEQPLGCNRVDGREQRWTIKQARFEEAKTP